MRALPILVRAAALIPIGSAFAHDSGEEQMERTLERLSQHVAVLPAASDAAAAARTALREEG
jgi:hypothetical protein